MKKVHLTWAKQVGKTYEFGGGMLVDYGIQFPLGSGYGHPVIDLYVAKEQNPLKLTWVDVMEESHFVGRDPILANNEDWIYSARVTFGEGKENETPMSRANQSHKVLLDNAQLSMVYNTQFGESGRISEPQLIKNVTAYITQLRDYGHASIAGNLFYFKEASRENIRKAIKQMTKKFSRCMQISDGDISMVVDALFADRIMSAMGNEGLVRNKVLVA